MEELLEIEPDQRDMTTKCNVYPWLNSKIKKKGKNYKWHYWDNWGDLNKAHVLDKMFCQR